jgi:hypothetical protein
VLSLVSEATIETCENVLAKIEERGIADGPAR